MKDDGYVPNVCISMFPLCTENRLTGRKADKRILNADIYGQAEVTKHGHISPYETCGGIKSIKVKILTFLYIMKDLKSPKVSKIVTLIFRSIAKRREALFRIIDENNAVYKVKAKKRILRVDVEAYLGILGVPFRANGRTGS